MFVTQLIIKVPNVEHVWPESLPTCQRVHPNLSAHLLEPAPELWIPPGRQRNYKTLRNIIILLTLFPVYALWQKSPDLFWTARVGLTTAWAGSRPAHCPSPRISPGRAVSVWWPRFPPSSSFSKKNESNLKDFRNIFLGDCFSYFVGIL